MAKLQTGESGMSRHKPGHTMRISEIRDSKKIQRELLEEENGSSEEEIPDE